MLVLLIMLVIGVMARPVCCVFKKNDGNQNDQ